MSSSVFRLLEDAVQTHRELTAIRYPVKGQYREMGWQEVYEKVMTISSSLLALDVKAGDRVAIISKTRLEWTLVDLGIIGAGACTVPLYHSGSDEDFLFILKDSQASFVFVENMDFVSRLRKIRNQLPHLKGIIVTDGQTGLSLPDGERSFVDFLALSDEREDAQELKARVDAVGPNDLASIVYTSGTTGEPKGAMITHDNFLYEAHAIEKLGIVSASDVQLLFLPLAHIFARILQIAWLKTKHILAFAEDIDRLADNILSEKPTLLAGVPRVFEKIHAQVVQQGLSTPGFKKRLVKWAFSVADEKRKAEMAGDESAGIQWKIAEALIFSKIKERLAQKMGGRLRFLISGGAALSPEVNYFFKYSGLTILEGWGLTETTAATCINLPNNNRIGTVGKAIPGTEVKIAEDGEILVRGRGVFSGYWKNEAATKAAVDADGFFHTGDIGVIQPGGFLKITDRKKDIIVTAAGKKIAPQKLEGLFKSASPLIAHAVIFGDKKPYIVALFTLEEKSLLEFAQLHGLKGNYAKLTQNEVVTQEVKKAFDAVNQGLANFEQAKKFAVLDHDFIIGEQLTPTLKVKRQYCSGRYADVFEGLYEQK